jgi:hypothetical protein
MARKGSKVMGLVAAFNSKADQPSAAEIEPDPKEIDAAFEAVLVRPTRTLSTMILISTGIAEHSREYASEFAVTQNNRQGQPDQVKRL